MALGNDGTACTDELVAAIRARLEAEKKGMGANVDLDAVKANLGALGTAVHKIATSRAETVSDAAADAAFWAWVASVNAYLKAMGAWQSGLVAEVRAWTPTTTPEQALRTKILALATPPAPPASPPSSLVGRIR